MSFKKASILFVLGLFAFISACSSESTEEKIHGHLEEAVAQEKGFEEQQSKITELEQKEQELYSQIIELGTDEMKKITELSQQAIDAVTQREESLKAEKESLDAAKEEFQKTEDLIAEIEDEQLKETAESMYSTMSDRFSAYDELYQAYETSIQQEKELYEMFQQEDTEQEALTEHINTINESYQQVLDANETFNTNTTAYNELKKEYYSQAGIEVQYEDAGSKGNQEGEQSEEEQEENQSA
ncbi:YkyA family protein [Oceanobacillus kapialis]|uniref:YkyA family protein n=1 Tax=Oceanobacillus kapialis TaxID=481353 RepID=UPI00384AD908